MLGHPVAHSLSPVLHLAAYRALGLRWRYDSIDCEVVGLPALLASSGPEWVGFSCTMPLKRALLDVAGIVSVRARAVGAGNTLVRDQAGGWTADNTDVAGILAALGEHGVRPGSVTLLGAGGTAQAAVVGLAELGVAHCTVLVRDPTRVGDLGETAKRAGVELDIGTLGDARPLGADLVISTLPAGAADAFAAHPWRPGQAVMDVVYSPWPTPLAEAVVAAGGTVVSGALMLLHQAARQVELMTGHPAPVAAMRAALRAATPEAGL